MNKFKKKLELLFEIARIGFCLPSIAFVLLFDVIWAVGGMEDQIAQRLGVVTLCSTVPAIVLNLIWLFTGNKEEPKKIKNNEFYRHGKKRYKKENI